MKKSLLTLIAAILSTWVMAQDDPTKMWLGGSGSYSSMSDDNDNDESSYVIGPSFGYMINPKIAVGIGIGYSGSKQNDLNSTLFEITPFARYYMSLSENCSVYGALNFTYGMGSDEVQVGTDVADDDYNYMDIGVAPGIQYWFHKRWSVNAEWGFLGYASYTDAKDDVTSEDFTRTGFSIGLDLNNITFGLNYHF